MSDSEASSPLNSEPSSPAPEQHQTTAGKLPPGNRFDDMFNSDESAGEDNAQDSDDEVSSRKRSRKEALGDDDEEAELPEDEAKELGLGDDVEDDLFGDEEDEDTAPAREASEEPLEYVESLLPRHPVPTPGSDGHLYLLKCPSLFSISPTLFDPEKFAAPTVDPESGITSYTAGTTAIRFRHHPTDPSQLQSNARVIRWSDGSLSLQVASSTNMWDLPDKALTTDPTRPHKYDPTQDSHIYLLDPHEAAGTLRVVGHATKQLKIVSSSIAELSGDTGVQKLRNELSKAAAERKKNTLDMSSMKDPEQERREAEKMLKEQEKVRKRQEAKKNKERANQDRVMNRRHHGAGTRSKRDSPPIYSRGGAGGRKEDEYDLEDDFIEGSEEEEEIVDDDEEEEEEFEDHRRRRGGGNHRDKRRRVVDDDDEDDE